MKNNYSVPQALAYHNMDLAKRELEVIRAMQSLQRKGQECYIRNIAREIGGMVESGGVTQSMENLVVKKAVSLDSFTTSFTGQKVQTYKLVTTGQGAML